MIPSLGNSAAGETYDNDEAGQVSPGAGSGGVLLTAWGHGGTFWVIAVYALPWTSTPFCTLHFG